MNLRTYRSLLCGRVALLLVCFMMILSGSALAQLARVGPVDNNNGFPQWYQDSTGLVLDACLPNLAELTDGTCLVTPDMLASPTSPITFPNNFPDEFFFFNATSTMNLPSGGNALMLVALEGAFLNGPVVAGDQMVFARLRIRIDVPSPGGTYRIIHPFGVEVFPDVPAGVRTINFTNDIGLTAGNFVEALNGKITTFLRASATAGGAPLPLVVLNGGNTFLTDPLVTTPITGSPFGTNVFRIEGPNIGGPGIDFIETDQFTLMGRVHLAPVPSPVQVTRATYRRNASSAQADVFANATPAIGVPEPILSVTGTNCRGTVMSKAGNRYFAQAQLTNPNSIPASLLITNSSDSPVTFTETDLVDEVQVIAANWDPATQMLTIQAASGDQVAPPMLMALGFGQLDGMGQLTVQTPLPPAEITVVSSWGGRDTRKVTLGTFTYSATAPYAADDIIGGFLPADVASTINILANDMPNMGVTPRILANPLHGTVVLDSLTGAAIYTPAPAYSGPDSFSYINNFGGVDSNVATVAFTVAHVNHAPVANPDATTASVTTAVTIDVLANDSDPDAGDTLDPLTVTIVTPPASGDAVPNLNGTITFSPAPGSSGNITFEYTVSDNNGLASNPGTVTVTVVSPDTLALITASFRTTGEWRIKGTSTIPGPGNTITIHNGPDLTSPVLGTIAVDTLGAFDFRLKNSSVTPGPTKTISIESTKGGQILNFPLTITN